MHVSPLLLGVVQLTIATTSVTAAALPRGRSRSRTHSAATFLKLRSPPAPNAAAERFVILPEEAVQTEKRDVVSADVYRRPTAGDDSVTSAAVEVSTDSINTSSGKNTQQPDLGTDEQAASSIVESLASATEFETFTYSNYAPASTSSSSVSAPSVTASSDPVQDAIRAAESYALKQQNVALPTVTVHLVMEPTQEADGTWDYIVRVGGDGTATASPTWISAPTAAPTSSASEYYVPSATTIFTPEASASIDVGEQSAPIQSSAEATPSYYYGNTHTWTGTPHANSSQSIETAQSVPVIDASIRNLLTTSSHFAFQCADATSYYYSADSDATQVCPGGTVCRFVDTACSPCVWPDQDIWCGGKIYSFLQPSATSATPQAPAASTTPTEAATIVTGSGYNSVVGETGRGAVTFTYTTSNAAVPTVAPVPTTTDMPVSLPTSFVYGSGYASASGETGRSAVTFTYSASSAVASSAEPAESTAWTSGHGGQHSYPWMTAEPSSTEPAVTAAPAESTAWTSGHGGQHSYPWMTESAASSEMIPSATISSADSALPTSLVETTTTLSNGAIIATLAPASSSSSAWESASTTVNSWLVEATKGIDPIQGGASSSTAAPQPTLSATESASGSATEVPTSEQATSSVPASSTGTAGFSSETLSSEPIPTTAVSSEFPSNTTVPTSSNVETATATDSVFAPTSTQSANGENATATWASSSSGILVPTSAVENGTAIVLPTASITSQASEPALTASATVSDPSDNGIATETATDWDIVNATSTTYVPYETASATATYTGSENATVWPTAMPTVNATLPTSTDALNVSISTVETGSAQPTGAFTSPIVVQWPANETTTATATEGAPSIAPTGSASITGSAWESVVTASETLVSSTASQSSESETPTGSPSSTQSSLESMITASATDVNSIASQSTESVVATSTFTSTAAEATETGSGEDECEEWEEVWVDERDIQDDWIIVE